MKRAYKIAFILIILGLVIGSGSIQTGPQDSTGAASMTTATPAHQAQVWKVTTGDLTKIVKGAVAFARENGKEKAIAAFNDPDGQFVKGDVYIFAEAYDGTALAEPFEHNIVGTNIRNMTDRYGVNLVQKLEETAGYGIGFVSYDYPNHKNNGTIEPKLSVVADVDGTYYVGAGAYASSGMVYPSTVLGSATRKYTETDLVSFVKRAVAYAKENGKENAIAAFDDKSGQFVDGEMTIIALDYNGTVLASSISPELPANHINLINYHDPDGVATIREMRDLAKMGGGFSYTVAKVTQDGRDILIPKIDYSEPVDGTWWLFSGIIVPGYEQLRTGNLTGVSVRNHSRMEVYDLVNRAVGYARENGKEKALAEINSPGGKFVDGDLFAWAETFDGTILADPYWKDAIGKNYMDFTDPYGAKTTVTGINTLRSGTGFTHAMFPDNSGNNPASVPKLIYMKAVDDTYWIGSGVYGVRAG
jgi:signal transduction histidine kinase